MGCDVWWSCLKHLSSSVHCQAWAMHEPQWKTTRGRTRKPVKKLDRSRNCASNSPEILVLSHFLTDSSFYLDPIFTGHEPQSLQLRVGRSCPWSRFLRFSTSRWRTDSPSKPAATRAKGDGGHWRRVYSKWKIEQGNVPPSPHVSGSNL
jgi:hypothetical protein